MSILFGHPTGNPNSHHAALAHFEAGRLEAFCVPWMPSAGTLRLLEMLPAGRQFVRRFSRRSFPPLAAAPKIQGRVSELRRLLTRAFGGGDEGLSYEANDWLMRTMRRECQRPSVTALHAYEDCARDQFEEAKRLGKACIYDMPIGFYPAWEQIAKALAMRYSDWLPEGGLPASAFVRPDQKLREMELADLVLAPSSYVERTVRERHPHKPVARAAYGVDRDFWCPQGGPREERVLRFLYAGQLSLRKGIPFLLEAWKSAGLQSAELDLVGLWQLSENKRAALPAGVRLWPPCSRESLRERYRASDVFLFPSFFEGFGLVLLEAMACGLPAIASDATAGPDVLAEDCGITFPAGDLEAFVEGLRWFGRHRDNLAAMARAARSRADEMTWEGYRRSVSQAVAPFV